MPHARTVAGATLWLLLAGCSTVQFGRDFDPRQFDAKVERGATSREAVRSWLGAPVASGVAVDPHGERFEEWTYYLLLWPRHTPQHAGYPPENPANQVRPAGPGVQLFLVG